MNGQTIERAAFAAAGGFLLWSGVRNRRPWRYALAALGAELIRRSISGTGFLYKRVQRAHRDAENDMVDERSEESFPASDAPATY